MAMLNVRLNDDLLALAKDRASRQMTDLSTVIKQFLARYVGRVGRPREVETGTGNLGSTKKENPIVNNNSDIQTNKSLKPGRPGRPPLEPSQDGLKLTEYLSAWMRRNNPEVKITEAQMRSWALEADRMFRIDHRPLAECAELVKWCQKDPFWKTNILSMQKFRKQYDQLLLKSRDSHNGTGGMNRAEQRDQHNAEVINAVFARARQVAEDS